MNSLPTGLDDITTSMLARETYETMFGIHQHTEEVDPKNPHALVMSKPATDLTDSHPRKREIKFLLKIGAPRKLGMSITEIFNLEPMEYLMVRESLEEIIREKGSEDDDDLEDMLEDED